MSENKDWLIICGPIFGDKISYHIVKGPVSTGALKQRVQALTKAELLKRRKLFCSFRRCDNPLDDTPVSSVLPHLRISSAFSSVFRVVMVGPENWLKIVDQDIFQKGL